MVIVHKKIRKLFYLYMILYKSVKSQILQIIFKKKDAKDNLIDNKCEFIFMNLNNSKIKVYNYIVWFLYILGNKDSTYSDDFRLSNYLHSLMFICKPDNQDEME